MKNITIALLCLLVSANSLRAQNTEPLKFDDVNIEYTKYVLDNGLTLLVHEDRKAPIVAVNIWYHVGSKNEPAGQTGFAHLFEHLMFNGSENYDDDYFQAMERIGATDLNGTTWFDRTNYFQNVPKEAFDIALWMESDRMGHFQGAISQERLDEQRDVVKNEKRQGDDQPYGKVEYRVLENCYPAGHPYRHTTIGSMDDLTTASLEDVKEWFRRYYGAANAVIVIAGDVSAEEAYNNVVKYFGNIHSGPPVTKQSVNIAKRTGIVRETMQDNVPQSRLHFVWNTPEYGHEETIQLDIVASILSKGKNSRLYKRLVYDEQIATGVQAYNEEHEIGSLFKIIVSVKPGVDNAIVEKAIHEELNKLLTNGASDVELRRAKTDYYANFVKGVERIGGFGGKSDILARNTVYTGNPDSYKERLEIIQNTTSAQVIATGNKWLTDGLYYLEVNPFPTYSVSGEEADRSKLPELGESSSIPFPEIQKETLSNGLQVLLVERNAVPVVNMRLVVNAGYSSDQFAKPGTAKLAMDLLDEGTATRTSLEINEQLQLLGANINTWSDLDYSYLNFNSLKMTFEESADVFTDILLNPAFPDADFTRLKQQQLISIQREKAQPVGMAIRVLPKYLYGEDHAYGLPLTGSGYESTVEQIQKEDLKNFYNTWFKPNNASLIVVGDITMDELKPILEKKLKKWQKADVPEKNLAPVELPAKNRIFLIDKPESAQSIVIGGHVFIPNGTDKEASINMMNNILGGEFTSRINMNIREAKGWAYGAFTFMWDAKGQRPFIAYAPVQRDKTTPAIQEMYREIKEYKKEKPATEQEFEKTKTNEILSLPGQYETMQSVLGSIVKMVKYDLSEDYLTNYPQTIRNIKLSDVQSVASEELHPENMTWLVVGDKEKVLEELKGLGYGDVVILDENGDLVE